MSPSANTNDLRKGMVVSLPEGLCQVLESQHHKPGKGQAIVRTKLRNLVTGSVTDRTFNSDTKIDIARLDRRQMQFLYRDATGLMFMDNETYDQMALGGDLIGEDTERYLTEGLVVDVAFHEKTPVSVELPTTVDLHVTATDPGVKGDRQSAGTKPATVQTGAVVQVPLFVDPGDVVRVDTRNGEYVTRVQ